MSFHADQESARVLAESNIGPKSNGGLPLRA